MAERLSSTLPHETSVRDTELAKVLVPTHPEREGVPLTPEEEAAFQDIMDNYGQTAPESTSQQPTTSLSELTQTSVEQPDTHIPQTPTTPPTPPAAEVPGVTTRSETPEFKLVMVDQSKDARDFARDAADARLTNELQEGGRFRKFVKGIWKGNLAKDYYRQKYTREAQTQIEASQDVLVHETGDAGQRARARVATIDRFQSDYSEMIHTAAGEDKNNLGADSELSQSLKGIIREYAEGNLSDEALLEERTRVVTAYREQHGDELVGEGLVRTDNILDVAQAVRGSIEHGESLDNVIENMKIITGEARTGARTEAHYSKADKVVEWLSKRRITALLPEATIATATAVASIVLRMGSEKALAAAGKTIIPGVGSAAIAAIRENKRTKDDRRLHAREMAVGKQFNEGDKRREKMEENRYETIAATDLIHDLRENHRLVLLEDSERAAGETKDAALQAALDALSAVEVRNLMSDSQNIDLIAYSDVANVNEERMQLALARAELKVALGGQLDAETRARLGLDGTNTVDGLIAERSAMYMDTVNEDISAKDKAFKSLRRMRVGTAAATGFAVGLTLGLTSSEVVSMFSDTRAGLVEKLWDADNQPFEGKDHLTQLEGIRHALAGGDKDGSHVGPSSEFSSNSVGEKGTLKLSNDHSLVHNPDGTLNFVDGNGKATVENLRVNPDGSLPPESLKILEANGMTVEDTHTTTYNVSRQEKEVSLRQYMAHHSKETTHVTRDLWYDNNTAEFDRNELGLQWTGTGVSKDGSVHLNVSAMTAGGSFHDTESTNWAAQATEGKLQLAISPSSGDQAHPFMVDINPDGTIDIPKDGVAAQFFKTENGEPVFNGRYAEVVQVGDKDAKGVTHIRPLATLVGTGEAADTPLRDVVTVRTPEVHPGYKITTGGFDNPPESTFTEMAPTIPINGRRSMESVRRIEVPVRTPYNPYDRAAGDSEGYGAREPGAWQEKLDRWASERSPRLESDPNATLKPREELDFYYDQQRKKRGQEYIDEINQRIDANPVLANLSADTRAIVAMPVHASAESDNIYNTLSLYAQQDQDAKQKTAIVMNVNWINDEANDPAKQAKIQKTMDEIERAKKDFPDLQLASFNKVWDRDWYENTRNKAMYGEIIKTLYDTAAFSVRRSMEEGRLADDQDVMLITNDADARGLNRHYFRQYIKAEEEHKDSDAFVGAIRWGTDEAEKFPGFYTSQLFMQAANIAASRTTGHSIAPATIGPNSAFRIATYAAVGGAEDYNSMGVGADSELGRKVLAARGNLTQGRVGYGVNTTSGAPSSTSTSEIARKTIRPVVGADIDTAPERLLNQAYRAGKFIPEAWGTFDQQSARTDTSGGKLINREDPKNNFPVIQKRVERQISDFITNWYPDRGVAGFTLSVLFPDQVSGSGEVDSSWKLKQSANGTFDFSFTDNGAKRFQHGLLKDGKGRADPVARRLRRRLYGEKKRYSRKNPMAPESPLVRPI